MPDSIVFQTVNAITYENRFTLGPAQQITEVYFTVSAPCYIQVAEIDKAGAVHWYPEIPLSGNSQGGFKGNGIRVRAYDIANPPIVLLTAYLVNDPSVIGLSNFTGILTSQGNIAPSQAMITGAFAGATGSIGAGTGFSVNRTGVGVYVVTYDTPTPFSQTPITFIQLANDIGFWEVASPSSTGFTIRTFNTSAVAFDPNTVYFQSLSFI